MLHLRIGGKNDEIVLFDEAAQRFITVKSQTIDLEHSLLSISEWESKWKVPFLGSQKTVEQTLDYIKCMTLTPNVDPYLYQCIGAEEIRQVQLYIDDSRTATWFNDKNAKPSNKVITSERIYSWMAQLNIPFECETWNLSRLLVLIRACNELNNPPTKMSRSESAAFYRQQNAMRHKARARR